MCHVAVTLRCVVCVSCSSDTEVCCVCHVAVTLKCVVCVMWQRH